MMMNTEEPVPAQERFPWKLFFLLALAMLLASLLVIPYSLQLLSAGGSTVNPQSMGAAITVTVIIQTIILYWPMALLGLLLARKLGLLGAPILSRLVEGQPAGDLFRRILAPAALVGFGAGILVLLLSGTLGTVIQSELSQQSVELSPELMPDAFQGFLASISAGINEEILLRLFLLTLIAWLIQRIAVRRSSGMPPAWILWTANVLAAVIFGLLHLPNLTVLGAQITPLIVGYVVLLNGLAGLAFGWLYWTFGLESAMLAHFFADIVLHVISVPLQGLFQ